MKSKVIVITGASSGIGAALALKLAAEGHRLALAARRERELGEVAARCGANAMAVVTDVTRRRDMERLREETLARYGAIDVWVNNAGRGIGKRVLEITDDDFDAILNVNLRSVLYGMQVIVPYFQQRGSGHLVNVSSYLGRVPFMTYRSLYSAAKSAVNSLTANLRVDLRQSHPGISVSLVLPGAVATDFVKNAIGGTPQPVKTKIQTAEEVADLMVALIHNPQPELYTNPLSAQMVKEYFADIPGWEAGNAEIQRVDALWRVDGK
jgi:short-subunit dehydrogenase